jgi:hypothetical protein
MRAGQHGVYSLSRLAWGGVFKLPTFCTRLAPGSADSFPKEAFSASSRADACLECAPVGKRWPGREARSHFGSSACRLSYQHLDSTTWWRTAVQRTTMVSEQIHFEIEGGAGDGAERSTARGGRHGLALGAPGADPGPPPLEVVELWRAGGFCMRCPSRFSRPCPCGCLWHLCIGCGMMHEMVARQLEPRVTNNLGFCFLLGAGGREARVWHKLCTAAPGLRLGIAAPHSGPASFGGQCRLFSHRKPGFGMVTWAWPGWQTRASGTSPK